MSTMIIEIVFRKFEPELTEQNLRWVLDDFSLTAICCADDVVLVAISVMQR